MYRCSCRSAFLVCRVWFFLAFKEQILGLINASTAAQAPDEVLPNNILCNITTTGNIVSTGSGSVSDNYDDTGHVNADDLGCITLFMLKLATCKADYMHYIFWELVFALRLQ